MFYYLIKLTLTSSYINCNVSADLPTPPLPTMMTLCITAGCCAFAFDMISTGFFFPNTLKRPEEHVHMMIC